MDFLKKFKRILIEYENIIFAYIFGSYVSGKLRDDSDIDIAIYLSTEISTHDYIEIKMKLQDTCKRDVDLVILNSAPPLLKYEIYKSHTLVFTRDKDVESAFKVRTLFEYDDMEKYLELSYKSTIERLKREVKEDGQSYSD